MQCEVIFKATQVDGVYDADPKKNPKARNLKQSVMTRSSTAQLKVMDTAAVALARENNIPVVVLPRMLPTR